MDQRIIIVATNAGTRAGGEAILPWNYYRLLRSRGLDAHLVTHIRNQQDLTEIAPHLTAGMHFIPDRLASRFLERAGRRLPQNIKALTTWLLMSVISSLDLRRTVTSLVSTAPGAVVVHEPAPVSPRQPSFMSGIGAPVVVGPMNGGMEYPPAFRAEVGKAERLIRGLLRLASDFLNLVIPGKREASAVLVANERTRAALPWGVRKKTITLVVENGVDLSIFPRRNQWPEGPPRFVYLGRLVDWKRVDLLLDAFAKTPAQYKLELIGRGPQQRTLEARVHEMGLDDRVAFHGHLDQNAAAKVLAECHALLLPSVYEAGGAVILEAMAVGLPVIATNWGGPADYVVHEHTGILIEPRSPAALVAGLTEAILRLGDDSRLARKMGSAGRELAEQEFDWDRKIDRMLSIYADLNRPGL